MRIVKKHQLDVLGLQETHLQDQEICSSQSWWLQKQGFAAHFNLQSLPGDKGSSGILWRTEKWEHVSSEPLGPRFLFTHLKAKAGGEIRFLTRHFSCEPTERKFQWERLEAKIAAMPPLPLVVLADHNSVMVPGADSANVSKEIPSVSKARRVEGSVLSSLSMEDVWSYIHGERRPEHLEGYTCLASQKRIDRVHVPPSVVHTVRSAYTVTTPSDHKAVVLQLGQRSETSGAPRFRFPLEMLECPVSVSSLNALLLAHAESVMPIEDWWDQLRIPLKRAAVTWRQEHAPAGYTELQALVRESTPTRLALGAWEFLEDLGYEEPTVASAYQRLVRLQSQEQREVFEEKMFSRLRAQLQAKEVRTQQMAERRKRIHEMVRQLRDRQYL